MLAKPLSAPEGPVRVACPLSAPSIRAFLTFLIALVLASPAAAQLFARIELEAPANPPYQGIKISAVQLYTGGDGGTLVGSWSGFLFAMGATSSKTFLVTATPDAARVTYQAPLGNASTVMVIDPLGLPSETILPSPSPGGTLAPAPGDPAVDAVVRISVESVVVGGDGDAPDCSFVREPGSLESTLQDTGSGLDSIAIDFLHNLVASVPAFSSGTNDPVVILGSVPDPEATVEIILDVRDVDGNRSICKSVTKRSSSGGGGDDVQLAGGSDEAGLAAAAAPALAPTAIGALAALLAAGGLLFLRRR